MHVSTCTVHASKRDNSIHALTPGLWVLNVFPSRSSQHRGTFFCHGSSSKSKSSSPSTSSRSDSTSSSSACKLPVRFHLANDLVSSADSGDSEGSPLTQTRMSRADQLRAICPRSNGSSRVFSLSAADGGRFLLAAEVGLWMGRTRSLQLVLVPLWTSSLASSRKYLMCKADFALALLCGPVIF